MSDLKVKVILEAVDRISGTMQRMAGSFVSALQKMSESTKVFGRKIKEMGKSISDIGGWISTRISAPIALAGRQAIETQKRIEALSSKMTAALGEQKLAEEQIRRLRSESDRLGVGFIDTADSYAGFAASITRAGFGISEVNKMFNDFAETTVSLKLTNEQIGYTFKALEQMASKPTISMEELKLQLADQIPGAVQIAAKSMNMTADAFMKAVSAGEIMSKDFLPKFSAALRSELGGGFEKASQSIQASENRMKNALTDTADAAAKAGLDRFFRLITESVTKLAHSFMNLSPQAQKFIVWASIAAAIVGPIVFIIGQMVIGIGGLIIGFGIAGPAIMAFVGTLSAMSIASLAVIAGIAALITAGILLWKNWDRIQNFFVQFWGNLKWVFSQGVAWIMAKLQPMLDVMDSLKTKWSGIFGGASGGLSISPSSAQVSSLSRTKIDTGGTLNIKIDSEGRPSVKQASPNSPSSNWDVSTGYLMGGAY